MNVDTMINRLVGKPEPKPTVTRAQALRIFPVRNPGLEWEEDEEGLVRATMVRRTDLWGRLVASALSTPETRQLQLDEVGSFVWQLCDGEHSMNDLVETMMAKYKLGRREVEASLNEFMKMLAKRGMVAVAVPKDLIAEMDPATVQAMGLTELAATEKPSTDSAEGQ